LLHVQVMDALNTEFADNKMCSCHVCFACMFSVRCAIAACR
jgi:hypothetical protein